MTAKSPRYRKRKGTQNEHRSIAWLEGQGFKVTRAAGSLGEFDLVAVKASRVEFIQVKSNKAPSFKEQVGMLAVPMPPCCKRVIHLWKDGKPAAPEVLVLGSPPYQASEPLPCGASVGRRPMVGPRPLEPVIPVRVGAPQPPAPDPHKIRW